MKKSSLQKAAIRSGSKAEEKSGKLHKSYRPGVERTRKILDAASALFVENGVDATTIDDIAANAGIAKGTFYHYYESKQALLIALQKSYIDNYNDYVLHAVSQCQNGDLNEQLCTWTKASLAELLRTMKLSDVLFTDLEMIMHWSVSREPFMLCLVNLFKRGNREKVWNVKHPELTAVMIFHGMVGAFDDALLHDGNFKLLEPKILDFVQKLCS